MKELLRLGVRQKVVLILFTVLLTALTVSSLLLLKELETRTLRDIQRNGNDISRYVSKSLAYSVVGYDYHTIQLLLDEITQSEDVVYAKVLSSKGNLMAEVDRRTGDGTNLVRFESEIIFDDTPVGRLELGISTVGMLAQLEEQKGKLFWREALVILLIALGEFLALSFFIVRPITTISRVLGDGLDSSGVIPRDIPLDSADELGDVARQFNHMRRALNDANRRLQSKIESADIELHQKAAELKAINKELKRLSVTDPLTGLYNRRYFESLVANEIASALRYRESGSLLILDLDHFKSVNDMHGHDAGDQVLRETALLLQANVRESDIVCRLGGEEFVVYCRKADRDAALHIAEKLRTALANHEFDVNDASLRLTTSVGLDTLLADDSTRNLATLYKRADIALYYSKTKGRNRASHFADITSTTGNNTPDYAQGAPVNVRPS
jgi:diguanylate cyclase (GGDEF)-like protein